MSKENYLEFKSQNADLISRVAADIKTIDEETHQDLVYGMRVALSVSPDGASSDATAGEDVLEGDVREDVAMALWLRGVSDGTQYLQQAAMAAQIERG